MQPTYMHKLWSGVLSFWNPLSCTSYLSLYCIPTMTSFYWSHSYKNTTQGGKRPGFVESVDLQGMYKIHIYIYIYTYWSHLRVPALTQPRLRPPMDAPALPDQVEIGTWFGSEDRGGYGKHFGPVYSVKRPLGTKKERHQHPHEHDHHILQGAGPDPGFQSFSNICNLCLKLRRLLRKAWSCFSQVVDPTWGGGRS